jgi:hypothetical protein
MRKFVALTIEGIALGVASAGGTFAAGGELHGSHPSLTIFVGGFIAAALLDLAKSVRR